MTAQTKLAVFGAGRWGVHLLRNFLAHPQAQVIAVVDPQPEVLTRVAQQFDLDVQTALLTDWTQVWDLSGLEAVAIATPASTHYSLIQAALQQGKHVLAEKPLALNSDECLELCQLAEHHQRHLVIDHTYLFHPAIHRGKAVLQAGILGDLRYGYATRTHLGPVRQDVDVLWDLAIHDVAIFNNWLDESPVYAKAQGQTWLQPPQTETDRRSDLVWLQLVYPSGFQATIHLCWANPDKQRRLCVVGSEGTLVFDELSPDAPLKIHHGHLQDERNQGAPTGLRQEVLEFEEKEPLSQVCNHFLTCVRQNCPSDHSSGWIGLELVDSLEALTQSLQRSGQRVPIKISGQLGRT